MNMVCSKQRGVRAVRRKKMNDPYSDPYTYGSNTSFDSHTSDMENLSGFHSARDYADENIPGIGQINKPSYNRGNTGGWTLSPGMAKWIFVAIALVCLGIFGACGGFSWLMAGVSSLLNLVLTAALTAALCWGFLCVLGRGKLYGARKKQLFAFLFLLQLMSIFIPGLSQIGISITILIGAVLLLLQIIKQ